MKRLLLSWLAAGMSWIVVEVAGGLLFLAAGVRLWRYEIDPVLFAITSPVIWCIAATLVPPLCALFARAVEPRLAPSYRLAARLVFFMTAGPVLEVVINELVFKKWFGAPLYRYLVLPTFDSSGSLLSPFYYATLLIHYPIADRVHRWLERAGPVHDTLVPAPDAAS